MRLDFERKKDWLTSSSLLSPLFSLCRQGILPKYTSCTFQQYAVIDSVLAAKTPSNFADEEVAGISLAAMTPNCGLYHPEQAGIEAPWSNPNAGKGKAIIILGGSSSVGQYGIQLARLSGFSKIVTSSSLKHREYLEKIGGTNLVVLDRNQAKPKDFLDATQGFKIETIFDSISDEETQKLAVEIFQGQKENSSPKVITVLDSSEEVQSLANGSNPKVSLSHVMAMGSLPHNRQVSEPLMKNLTKWLENKEFFPNRVEVVKGGLKGLEEALDKNRKGVSGVKIVVKPSETS